MKTTSIIALFALACIAVAPVYAAGPALDTALKAAARDSEAGLSDICKATYDAVKETPEEADKILEAVLAQRTDWKASQVYAIFRSVLLARPDLTAELSALVTKHVKDAKDGKNGKNVSVQAPGSVAFVGVVTESETLSEMLGRLVGTVYEAALGDGIAEEALNMVIASVAGVYAYSYSFAFPQIGVNTNMEFTDMEFIPAPEDMTQN